MKYINFEEIEFIPPKLIRRLQRVLDHDETEIDERFESVEQFNQSKTFDLNLGNVLLINWSLQQNECYA